MILSSCEVDGMISKYLSIDIGASSGRAVVVIKDKQTLRLDEAYRFKTKSYEKEGLHYWDFNDLFKEVVTGIEKAFFLHEEIKSIGIDTFGVDYGRLDQNGTLNSDPLCYRNKRFIESSTLFHESYSKEALYSLTGIQYLPFNTIYQLYDHVRHNQLNKQETILLLPNLIGYFLTGNKQTEVTNASTTALYDSRTNRFVETLFEVDKQKNSFASLVNPGVILGETLETFNFPKTPVINVCSHDTASAFVSTRILKNQALISSGTWSLVGTILAKPKRSKEALRCNFTNELGYLGQTRFLKNIMGMWLINESRSELMKSNEDLSFFDLEKKAISSEPFLAFIDPDDEIFLTKGSMIERMRTYLEKTNQNIPIKTEGMLRVIYESLAFKYRYTIEQLEKVLQRPMDEILIIGGGSQSKLLNQMTANFCKKRVITGAVEATVLGNAIVQMHYFKEIKTIKSGQTLIEKSFKGTVYEPTECEACEEAYERFLKLIEGDKS